MDILFILLPSFLPLVLIILFQDYFSQQTEVNTFWWMLLVLNIDVAHVYSTLFRFYWETDTFNKYKSLLVLIPLIAFAIGVTLHFVGAMVFWRVLAYIAVFHFVRQQYGFMRLYSRTENYNRTSRFIDSLAIYSATLYPLLYWHSHLTSELHWFVQGDFFTLPASLGTMLQYLYWGILITYGVKELIGCISTKYLNLPKNLLVLGTCVSWYLGIITFKGDLIFTLFNVVAHGIPYMALVFFFSRKKANARFTLPWMGVTVFILTVIVLAYLEEGLWDGFVWRDHENVFPLFSSLPYIENPLVLSFLVPLLALPQLTHYIVDGFIWRKLK